MSAREELLVAEGRKLHDAWFAGPDMEQRDRMIRMANVARELHKPRPITEPEELDSLPVGSVVKDEDGHAHMKYPRGWVRTGQEPFSTPEGILPGIVIHEATS